DPLRRSVHDRSEDQREDEGESDRLHHRPSDAEEALLVADLELALGEEVDEVAELPQLVDRPVDPARRRDQRLRDRRRLRLRGAQVVLPLAANVGGIGYNRRNPGPLAHDNLAMGLNVFEACRELEVEKMVAACSVCAYPKFTPVPFREEEIWNGYPEESNAPYGIAKKALLTMCQAYRAQYGMDAIYLLPVNLYGPGDNFDLKTSHVVPALIRKCVEAK